MTVELPAFPVDNQTLDVVAAAASFNLDATRMQLRRLIERAGQQGQRIIGCMDAGRTHDGYSVIVEDMNALIGQALTVAAELDVLATIARRASGEAGKGVPA